MKTVLAYKTETTGFVNYKARSKDECQPHLVRLSAILYDSETKDVVDKIDFIIKPEGWVIPQETIDVHNINNEKATNEGISEREAIEAFLVLLSSADQVVTSNKQFNSRIIRIAISRYIDEKAVESWKNIESHCAMKMAKDDMNDKTITLNCALSHYAFSTVENHDSLVDAESAAKIFFAINNKS